MSNPSTANTKLPVTIITGFLGSGKTTLLNYILQNFGTYKVAVLVNEFGDINIDSQLLIAVEEDMIELTNGCICCTINDNLADAVYRVLERRDRIEYLIVETTGVADPLPIAVTFLRTELRDLTQLDSIVTVVDAETFTPAEHYNSDAAISQILYGDIILLNKTDLVSEPRLKELEDYLHSVKECARILRSQHGKVPLSLILDINLAAIDSSLDSGIQLNQSAQHLNNDGFMSVSFQSDRPLSVKKFQQFIDYQLPDNVFRAKGLLWFVESPKRHLFQLSGKRFTIDDYNTLTRRKEPFTPIQPGQVTMYCCGVTVYDDCHLGHARSYIVWDVVRRYLQWRSYSVCYVQNFTDIDDKILNRAQAEGATMQAVSDRYIAAYFRDIRRLNILDADEYPRVTEHIPAIHQLIQALEDKGYAYAIDGDVYYNVRQFAEYGKLSGRQLEQMQAGAGGRVDPNDPEFKKQYPFDFALWKAAKPGEPAWESPWGQGRPGWHIECSAMIRARLGDAIDIHGGGGDLIFPHHENEIAQSEVLTRQPLARYWLHNGMVTVNGEKMSKSLENFTTIRALLEGSWSDYPQPVDPMAIRLFVLQAHYRKPRIADTLECGPWVDRLVWHPTCNHLAFNQGKTVQIWDADQAEAVTCLTGIASPQDIRWLPDGKHLANASQR